MPKKRVLARRPKHIYLWTKHANRRAVGYMNHTRQFWGLLEGFCCVHTPPDQNRRHARTPRTKVCVCNVSTVSMTWPRFVRSSCPIPRAGASMKPIASATGSAVHAVRARDPRPTRCAHGDTLWFPVISPPVDSIAFFPTNLSQVLVIAFFNVFSLTLCNRVP